MISSVTPSAQIFDPSRAWMLCPQVSVRPEPFGALLYHFGNRRLSFLKDRVLLSIVQSIETYASANDAISASIETEADPDRYVKALAALVASEILAPAETRIKTLESS
jgi:putative mycofactocin binding protein MftB